MRVLFPYPRAFGYFPDIYEYVTLLRARGIDAYYVGIQPEQNASARTPYVLEYPEKNVQNKDFIRFAGQQIATIQPDIVHSFHFRGCGALPLLARNSARKWIIDVRTIHVETRDLKISSDFWLRDRLTWLETQAYNYVLALTKTIQGKLKPSIRPIQIIPLGASYDRLNPSNKEILRAKIREQLNIPAASPVILYAGSLSPTRQMDKIVTGFSLIVEHFPTAILLLVGGQLGHSSATDPLIRPLSELAQRLGISSNVLFTGRVPYSDTPSYFAASDVGVSYMPLGTPHQFQPPTKLIEYMMAGMVAASNRIPAVDGLITDGVDGILFDETEEEIAVGLQRSLDLLKPSNQASFLQITTKAQDTVRNRDWQHIVDEQLIPLYEKLCGKPI